jgi:hypothetical protein
LALHFFKLEKKKGDGHADRQRRVIFNYDFSGRTFGLCARGVHRQAQAGSMVSLQIQTGSFGEPPTPSASDLTLELDQY